MAELLTPTRIALTGEIISVKEMKMADYLKKDGVTSKFNHDCRLVRLDLLDGSPLVDIYVTDDQWKRYGMIGVLFVGNLVTVDIDQCVKDETGYYDGNDEWQFHKESFNAFAGANNVGKLGMVKILIKQGITVDMAQPFLDEINANRKAHEAIKPRSVEIPTAESVVISNDSNDSNNTNESNESNNN